LSSTTSADVPARSRASSRSGERGQVLVLFAGGVLALLGVAALAFDVGMMLLERRDQQNSADAAALAGARFAFDPDCVAPAWTCANARQAARDIALVNGYDDADATEQVQVHIPPIHGRYGAFPNFVEVEIDAERPSIFGGVFGKLAWPIGVFATASNGQDLRFPFSMIALNKTACKAIHVSGQGEVIAFGNIQANSNGSDCSAGEGGDYGMSRTGGGEITIIADDATCRSAGEIQDSGSGTMTCTQAPGSFALPDPLQDTDEPVKPGLAASMVQIGSPPKSIQDRCPGGSPAPTETQTQACDIAGNGGSHRGTQWLLSPGLYPAGLTVDNQSRAYLLPGIYWIGGGGLNVNGDASLITVDSASEATTLSTMTDPVQIKTTWDAGGGGVLIYNSKLPTSPGGNIDIGGGGGSLLIKPLDAPGTDWHNMSVFQDPSLTTDIFFNGSNADAEVAGIVYAPGGHVQVNGSSSEFFLDQVIADTFKINGSTGTIHVLKRVGIDAVVTAAGLVD
jgi:hypothetical protein